MKRKSTHLTITPAAFQKALLDYFDTHKRSLPWREARSAYKVWLSEIMLQQTTVRTVIPYFQRFLHHYPTVKDLARADEQDVLHLWQGLGYYSRARNLLKCAKVITAEHNGQFPATAKELEALPGIGPYTAAAIAAIYFKEPVPVVDGNIERIVARLLTLPKPPKQEKLTIKAFIKDVLSETRPGDFAEAMMDLGSGICTPKNPKCDICPLASFCQAFQTHTTEKYPVKATKTKRPHKTGTAYIIEDSEDKILLQQRPSNGLLGGLWQPPVIGWDNSVPLNNAIEALLKNNQTTPLGTVEHIFSHFSLALDVQHIQLQKPLPHAFNSSDLPPLPTVFKKVLNKKAP